MFVDDPGPGVALYREDASLQFGVYMIAQSFLEGCQQAVGGLSGDALPYTPKYSVGANADYEWELGGETKAYVGASIRSLSKQPAAYDFAFRSANGRQRYLPSYEVMDLRAGVDFGAYSVELYAKNLTDSEGKTSLEAPGNIPLGAAGTAVIRPRTVGVTLTADF